jgi:predicted O-methyltransferase YrrM
MPTGRGETDAAVARIAQAGREEASRGDLLARILREAGVRAMAEIGVWRGGLSARLLRDCHDIETYHMIDPWRRLPDWRKPLAETPDFDAVHDAALAATAFAAARRQVHRGTTTEMIDRLPDGSLDALYIDGDHTLRGVLIDLIAGFDKVRIGGMVLGDDFSRNPFQHGTGFEPTLVFPAAIHVAEAKGCPIVILPHGQFAILRAPERAFAVIDTVGGHDDRSILGAFGLG